MKNIKLILFNLQCSYLEMIFHLFLGIKLILKILIIIKLNIIEYRKENNKKFEKLYEGNDNKCSIKKLSQNNNYEFRFCISYNDIKNINENILKVFIPSYKNKKIKEIFNEINNDYNILSLFDEEVIIAKIEEFNLDREKINKWINDNL